MALPLEALREAVTNSLCHREYLTTAQTQVRIYDRELLVMNPGGLPSGITVAALKREHHSFPRNRQIAEMFFYAGLIEGWGSGIGRMMDECRAAGMPRPMFEDAQGFRVTFRKAVEKAPEATHETPHVTPHVPPMSPTEERLLAFCRQPRSRSEIVKELGLSPDHVRKDILPGLIRAGKLVYTIPEKPRSTKQRYLAKPA